jgi:hypothetical protein
MVRFLLFFSEQKGSYNPQNRKLRRYFMKVSSPVASGINTLWRNHWKNFQQKSNLTQEAKSSKQLIYAGVEKTNEITKGTEEFYLDTSTRDDILDKINRAPNPVDLSTRDDILDKINRGPNAVDMSTRDDILDKINRGPNEWVV